MSVPHCADGFYCRVCGGMFCEHRPCECYACPCPCHGPAVVIHTDEDAGASPPVGNPRQ